MPMTKFGTPEKYKYQNGFNSYHESEAIEGALPVGANSPQKPPYGLYAEKLSGTAFTAPRSENLQTWLYRILPTAAHGPFEPQESTAYNVNLENSYQKMYHIPNQLRWDPFDLDETVDWVHSLHLVAGAGNPTMKSGIGIFIFSAGKDMNPREAFYSADGDFLIVPQHGVLDIQTELGHLLVRPNEIAVIPRGIRYRVTLPAGPVRGYILELYQGHFQLPELGPVGSNCLANARDFQAPVAAFNEDTDSAWHLLSKFNGRLFAAKQNHTPFDVVAWHGQYYPFKYDLGRFNTIGSISFDHPDPSIFTVLSAPSDHSGTAIADFVIFPPRWLVAEDTFRPPWYHRNTMSEFMGLIHGGYDAKIGGGFCPAGASLHNVMSAHGPDASTHEKASSVELKPAKVGEGSMAFMFESCLMVGVTEWGLKTCKKIQEDYNSESWEPLKPHFKRPEGTKRDGAGESGKSTILKQMKLIYASGFSIADRDNYRCIIYSNIVNSMRTLLAAMEARGLTFDIEENEQNRLLVSLDRTIVPGERLPTEYLAPLKSLWADKSIQKTANRGNELALHDNLFYYFEDLDRLFAPAYVPSNQDILRSRLKTTGISETIFDLGKLTYRMFDVGGQRSERRKWIHCFENVHCVLFLVAISGYDQCLVEEMDGNQMQEALMLFGSISNSRWFTKTALILFLNKMDLFRAKLVSSPIRKYFPDYEGDERDERMACEYFKGKFLELCRDSKKEIYTHFTNATDTNLLKITMASVQDMIIQRSLNNLYFA